MTGQIQKQKPEQQRAKEALPDPVQVKSAEKLKAELDSVLDDIEGVLEENAEAFIAAYIQLGGE